jgi:large subunit ribosomal protein L25
MTKTVRVFVEIKTDGKAIGLSEGGLLNVVTRQVEVECLPTAIPETIIVDISNLSIGSSIHASDLNMPEGVKLISRPEITIAAVVDQEDEVAAAPAAAAATPAAAAATPATAAGAAKPAAGAAKPAAKK